MTDHFPRLSALLPPSPIDLRAALDAAEPSAERSALPWTDALASLCDGELRRTLDVPLATIFAQAWNKSLSVAKALAETEADPASTALVELADHEISDTEHPELVFGWNGATLCTVTLDVELTATFKGAALVIRRGALDSVETGEIAFTLSLRYGQLNLLPDWTPEPIRLRGRISLKAEDALNVDPHAAA